MTARNPGDPPSLATTLDVTVRSTDMDADRTVNNAVFFQYFEQSRLEHLLRHGVIDWPPRRDGGAPQFALAQTSAQFRASAVHRDVLMVTVHTVSIGTRSFALAYDVRRKADGVLVCEGSSVQVWLDATGGAATLPAAVRAALMASLETDRQESEH